MAFTAFFIQYWGKYVILKGFAKKNYIISIITLAVALWILKLFIDHKQFLEKLKEDKKCWKNEMLTVNRTMKYFLNAKEDYIPSAVEFAPKGRPASVPKIFLIEEKEYCTKKPLLKAIAFVHTAINRTEKRNFTRHSWAKFSDKLGVVFFVGQAKNQTEKDIINEESKLYHDIVQGRYTDQYELLTYKGLNGLHWVTKNCGMVPWVIHADDDILIDVNQLFKFLNNLEGEHIPNEIFGLVFKRSIVQREGKWKVDMDEYPCVTYPSYCAGPAWFTNMKVINSLLSQVPNIKYLWVDDVYVTGLLAVKAGVRRTDVNIIDKYFKESHMGETIAWTNVLTNRTLNWQSLLSYYQNVQNV